jgi:ornithine carbamoyltransferase
MATTRQSLMAAAIGAGVEAHHYLSRDIFFRLTGKGVGDIPRVLEVAAEAEMTRATVTVTAVVTTIAGDADIIITSSMTSRGCDGGHQERTNDFTKRSDDFSFGYD